MTDQNTPLTDEERAELEALRAEKARREEEERARRERAELEALRAERDASNATSSSKESVEAPAPKPPRAPAFKEPVADPQNLTFGQKMVMTKDEEDEDGMPPMPPAQKLIIAIGVILLVVAGFWIVKNNLG